MVLIPLGSSQTKIQVNGQTEYGPTEQGDNSTYNINATAQANVYRENVDIGNVRVDNQNEKVFINPDDYNCRIDVAFTLGDPAFDYGGSVKLYSGPAPNTRGYNVDGSYLHDEFDPDAVGGQGSTGYLYADKWTTDDFWWLYSNGDNADGTASIDIEVDIPATITVNDVNKSNGV